MTNPTPLKTGDVIGIAASSSPFDRNDFKKGVQVLEHMGFEVFYRNDIFDQNRYFAGTDERRAEELTELFLNKKIKAIMFARGGYGSQRVIPLLDDKAISANKKPVIGFSDLTALLTFLRQNCEVPTFYGPVLTMLGRSKNDITIENLSRALLNPESLKDFFCGESATVSEGSTAGPLIGGCLSLICSSMGTPYELKSDDSIIFLEDVGEKLYVIDRMLTQLKNAGIFSRAKGIIMGSVVLDEKEKYDLNPMLKDVFRDFGGPIISNFPAGHTHPFVTLPFGAQIEINARTGAAPEIKQL